VPGGVTDSGPRPRRLSRGALSYDALTGELGGGGLSNTQICAVLFVPQLLPLLIRATGTLAGGTWCGGYQL
jgi:hypothetical protein